ncbi:hypothetical protein C8E03_11120 [Lachnotalea glycerini]|uniref:Uncharacterized protein n=1 Tax=Lachnotalea glycerini TaxID=1763509 RepID=A0A318EIG9_9FIRM|nr:hypothetical protein C8E03_11120 [Lachnotalea glycerini]
MKINIKKIIIFIILVLLIFIAFVFLNNHVVRFT